MTTVSALTLGCKVNQAESEGILETFRRRGYEVTADPERAEVVVLNSCAVTLESERKSMKSARRLKRLPHKPTVIVTGCFATLKPDETGATAADLVVGNHEKGRIAEFYEAFVSCRDARSRVSTAETLTLPTCALMRRVRAFDDLPQAALSFRTRTHLKIQDGCSHGCTYCIVPALRGRERSLAPERVLEVLDELDRRGVPEVVLTGIHLAVYGRDLTPKTTLARLIAAIAGRAYGFRVRLSSLEPQDVRDDLAGAVYEALPAVCPHFHLPLQSGSDRVLKSMRRGYTAEKYEALIASVRACYPGFGISTDIIVGFPGETDEDFEQTLALARRLRFVRIHAFPYSPRPGTPAAGWPPVPDRVKGERQRALLALGAHLRRKQCIEAIGRDHEVLVEGDSPHTPPYREGYTETYLPALTARGERGARLTGRAVAAFGDQILLESSGG